MYQLPPWQVWVMQIGPRQDTVQNSPSL